MSPPPALNVVCTCLVTSASTPGARAANRLPAACWKNSGRSSKPISPISNRRPRRRRKMPRPVSGNCSAWRPTGGRRSTNSSRSKPPGWTSKQRTPGSSLHGRATPRGTSAPWCTVSFSVLPTRASTNGRRCVSTRRGKPCAVACATWACSRENSTRRWTRPCAPCTRRSPTTPGAGYWPGTGTHAANCR